MSNPPSASTAGLTRASATTATTSLSAKSSHASSRLYDIPSLDDEGSNFQTWKYQVEMILDVRGLEG